MMGGPGGKPDNNMMLEIQLKMARRAEKAAAEASPGKVPSPGVSAMQQQQLLAKNLAVGSSKKGEGGGLVEDLADGAANGSLFAQRRALARKMAEGGQ